MGLFILIPVTASVVAVKSSLTVIQGQSTKISCTVSGDPTPSVTWYYDNEVVPNADSENIALGDQNTSLLFNPVLNSHEGAYVCAVDNGVGEDNDTILLNVISKQMKVHALSSCVCYLHL